MAITRDKIIEDAKKLAADVAAYVGENKEGMSDRVQQLKKQAQSQFEDAKDVTMKHAKDMDKMAKENVWAAVGIAAAVGAVVGMLFSKKRD